jgi:hypothetical protein
LVAGGFNYYGLHGAAYEQKRGGYAQIVSLYDSIASLFELNGD